MPASAGNTAVTGTDRNAHRSAWESALNFGGHRSIRRSKHRRQHACSAGIRSGRKCHPLKCIPRHPSSKRTRKSVPRGEVFIIQAGQHFDSDQHRPACVRKKYADDMLVATSVGTSVNHAVAQKRALTGNNAWKGRTLPGNRRATVWTGMPLPNVNMAQEATQSAELTIPFPQRCMPKP